MRITKMFPLACTAALRAACAAEAPRSLPGETASSGAVPGAPTDTPSRDLTLQLPAAPALEVASPVELSRPDPTPTTSRPKTSRRPAPVPAAAPAPAPKPVAEISPVASAVVPIPSLPVTGVEAQPVEEESAAAGSGRELAPGKTVPGVRRLLDAGGGRGLLVGAAAGPRHPSGRGRRQVPAPWRGARNRHRWPNSDRSSGSPTEINRGLAVKFLGVASSPPL